MTLQCRTILLACLVIGAGTTVSSAADWPQPAGPNGNYCVDGQKPVADWNVAAGKHVLWLKSLPETGQSHVTVHRDRLFFTTYANFEKDTELGSDVVAWCCKAGDGSVLWKRMIEAEYPLRVSGCFSDSTAPGCVVDGDRACFFNASGTIACFDLEGNALWSRHAMPVGRTQPFLIDGAVVYIRQNYMPEDGKFSHAHKNAPQEKWTQLQALEMISGDIRWTSKCGVNMGCVPMLQRCADGKRVAVVGRGGGHSPPEHPEGISLVDLNDGSTLWTLPLEGFMSTMTYPIHGDHVLVFHRGQHLWVDAMTGEIERTVSFTDNATVRARVNDAYVTRTETIPGGKKPRAIIQQSNLLVGDYHYFRSYTQPYLGRVHAVTGRVEYLQLPVQLVRGHEPGEQFVWDATDIATPLSREHFRVGTPVSYLSLIPNDMKNSRGFEVMGDSRSRSNGWGHHAAAIPTAVDSTLYIPILNGTVYVIDAEAEQLDLSAILAINDLGPAGKTYTRSSLTFANGRIYARTIRSLICLGSE